MKKKHSTHNFRNRSWRCIISFTIAFGIITASVDRIIASQKNEASYDAKVVAITDGDTVKVLTTTNEQVKIRIYGIDAPEKKQAYGSKAKDFLSSLVFGCNVTVKPTGSDLYGRTIAKIYNADRDVGLAMIESGYAWWYQQYAKKELDYKKAQDKARKQELGLWTDPKPIAPWKFRKEKKQ